MDIHIHAPLPCRKECRREKCPVCEKRSVILSWFTDWYGWSSTCLRCGDRWEDGELLPRPFAPRWRERNKEEARKRWRQGKLITPHD